MHNALVGQWSEMRQVKNETTAITALKDSLEIALLEAFLLLNDGQERSWSCFQETPLSVKYNAQPVERLPLSYALAMVVEKGSTYQLSLQSQVVESAVFFDNALTWCNNIWGHQWQTQSSRGGTWLWKKNLIG